MFCSLGVCEQFVEVCDVLGWKLFMVIQVDVVLVVFQGYDIIGLVQMGLGKMVIFVLLIFQVFLENLQFLFVCVLFFMWEFVIQIVEQFEVLGLGIGLKCVVLVGGIDMMVQFVVLVKWLYVVVGIFGRLVDYLINIRGFSLCIIKYLVFDEVDWFLNMDFEQEIDEILKVIFKECCMYLFFVIMIIKVVKL